MFCSYIYCWSVSSEEGKRHFFTVPKDKKLRKQWADAIKRKDRKMSNSSKVCHIHFTTEELAGNYRQLLIDGRVVLDPKCRWELPKGSVPSLFPGVYQFSFQVYFVFLGLNSYYNIL